MNLTVKVPADADVYLVNQKMSIKGAERRFLIPIKDPGREYSYPIRVEVVRGEKKLVKETTQKIRGGQRVEVTVTESKDSDELVALALR